ncbi:MAG: hypothetical protein IRY83_11110 [Chloroflexi bacterium]|nr:hypothetical protein [Chloroflexota bacterium]
MIAPRAFNAVLSFTATAISLAFAVMVLQQYARRRRPYQAVWGGALLLFGAGTGCQLAAELVGWTALLYRIWYLTGAMLGAAYLGQGTVYLLAPRHAADLSCAVLVAASLVGLVLIAALPVDLARAIAGGAVTGNGFSPFLLILLIPLNTYGTLALVGGALWSAYRGRGSRTMRRRTVGTFLIAVGGLTVALGGTANRLGWPGLLYLSELIGIALIFLGYLQTTVPPAAQPAAGALPPDAVP